MGSLVYPTFRPYTPCKGLCKVPHSPIPYQGPGGFSNPKERGFKGRNTPHYFLRPPLPSGPHYNLAPPQARQCKLWRAWGDLLTTLPTGPKRKHLSSHPPPPSPKSSQSKRNFKSIPLRVHLLGLWDPTCMPDVPHALLGPSNSFGWTSIAPTTARRACGRWK